MYARYTSREYYRSNILQFYIISDFFCFIDNFDSRNVLVMNNARIYHNAKLKLMCKNVNVTLTFLSFYFFDYNFIEILFAILKI